MAGPHNTPLGSRLSVTCTHALIHTPLYTLVPEDCCSPHSWHPFHAQAAYRPPRSANFPSKAPDIKEQTPHGGLRAGAESTLSSAHSISFILISRKCL